MEIRTLEHRPAVTCRPETSIDAVAATMRDDNVGSVIVLDEHERIVGIVTDRDLVVRGIAEGATPDTPVEKVMSRNVSYIFDNADVCVAATEMAARGIRRLPVLDAKGHLTGVVSFDDMMMGYSDEIERLARAVRKEVMTAALP